MPSTPSSSTESTLETETDAASLRSEGSTSEKFDLVSSVSEFLSGTRESISTSEFARNCCGAAILPIIKDFLHQLDEIINDSDPPLTYDECRNISYQRAQSVLEIFQSEFQNQARHCTLLFSDPISDQLLRGLLERIHFLCENFAGYDFDQVYSSVKNRDRTERLSVLLESPDPSEDSADESDGTSVVTSASTGREKIDPQDLKGKLWKRQKPQRPWNHLTISRDQTSAGNADRELLSWAFRSILGEETADTTGRTLHEVQEKRLGKHRAEQRRAAQEVGQNRTPQSRILKYHHSQSRVGNRLADTTMYSLAATSGRVSPPLLTTTNLWDSKPCPRTEADLEENTLSTCSAVADESYSLLRQRIAVLEKENQSLKKPTQVHHRWETLHLVDFSPGQPSTAYLDEPFWSISEGEARLVAHLPITDIRGFLQQKQDIAFVVSKYYSPRAQHDEVIRCSKIHRPLPPAESSNEKITLNSQEMIEAAEEFFALQPKFSEEFPGFNIKAHIPAPYLFWYQYRSANALTTLSPAHQTLMQLLTTWIEEHYRDMYDRVKSQMSRGVISRETLPFLVKPGDVIVSEDKQGLKASVARSWPLQQKAEAFSRKKATGDWKMDTNGEDQKRSFRWSVDSWRYEYDGLFLKSLMTVYIDFKAASLEDEVDVHELSAYPLQYAPESFRSTLEKRGNTFWKCRHQNIVSYEDNKTLYGNGERFMVDFQTYRQLHSDSTNFKDMYPEIDDPSDERMSTEVMESHKPPSSPDIYVFPNKIPGYDLQSKKWVDLQVDMIHDVSWNKKSFDHLVVEEETKELIQALVMHQIAREKSTDIIDRKGNGLIILLHGGPGTGKTLTAESVAELAEKPLFRVTCGDIGTKPEQVEKYLESVLHLGKTWGCVVLIDEAEVFLEQRSLDNLERNALVSVFLRVLEYYEGILILTSNRVGTFDEAFKSRILLSLHYENLTQGQRAKIWKNFLSRLKGEKECSTSESDSSKPTYREETGFGIDFDDIECYVTELAQYDLNGRQIRNAITAARQLAKFRNQQMSYQHLKHVITVSSKFEKYLKTIQEGYSSDQIARTDGIR